MRCNPCVYRHTQTPKLKMFLCSLKHGLAQTWKRLKLAAVSKYWKGDSDAPQASEQQALQQPFVFYLKCLLTQKVPGKLDSYVATLPRKTRYFISNNTEAGKLCSKCVTLAEVSLSWRHVEQGEIAHPGNCAVHHGNPQRSWESVDRQLKWKRNCRLCINIIWLWHCNSDRYKCDKFRKYKSNQIKLRVLNKYFTMTLPIGKKSLKQTFFSVFWTWWWEGQQTRWKRTQGQHLPEELSHWSISYYFLQLYSCGIAEKANIVHSKQIWTL